MTLNEIVKDILLIARGGRVSQSETITDRQVAFWVHTYRAILFKQSFDKYSEVDRGYIQALNCMELEEVDTAECPTLVTTNRTILRTVQEIPKVVATRKGLCFTFIGDIHGKPFQLSTEENIPYYLTRKYSGKDIYVFIRDRRIYVVGNKRLEKISIRGVFENPTELASYINNCNMMVGYTHDDPYPIGANVIPILKEMILTKEIKMETGMPSDNDNDASNKQSPNRTQ